MKDLVMIFCFKLNFHLLLVAFFGLSDGSDYTFSSPADFWPSSSSLTDLDSPSETEAVVPRRHIRLFRKVAGWLARNPSTQRPVARLETAGSQASFI